MGSPARRLELKGSPGPSAEEGIPGLRSMDLGRAEHTAFPCARICLSQRRKQDKQSTNINYPGQKGVLCSYPRQNIFISKYSRKAKSPNEFLFGFCSRRSATVLWWW